jgi:hypothetical protein
VGSREFDKEGSAIDPKTFMPQKGPRPFLPKRWVVERSFSWLGQNGRTSLWTTDGCPRARKPSSTLTCVVRWRGDWPAREGFQTVFRRRYKKLSFVAGSSVRPPIASRRPTGDGAEGFKSGAAVT